MADATRSLRPGASAEADAKKIRELGRDSKVLKGWWGKQKAGASKSDPTLGQVAIEVANRLEEVAKRPGTK